MLGWTLQAACTFEKIRVVVFNNPMVYLFTTVAHYRQLSRINQALLEEVAAELAELEKRFGYARAGQSEGSILILLGSELGIDPWRAVEFAFAFHQSLDARRDDLFGFNLMVAVLDSELTPSTVIRQLENRLIGVEEDEELWFDAESWALVSGFLTAEASGGLYRVVRKVLPDKADKPKGQLWKQRGLARALARTIQSRARSAKSGRVVLLHGHSSVERRLVLDAVQTRLFSGTSITAAPRVYTLSSHRSTIHPFLNGVDPFLLEKVPQYLLAAELGVWKELGGLLHSLKPGLGTAPGLLYRWPKGVPDSLRSKAEGGKAAEKRDFLKADLEALGGFRPEQLTSVCPDHLLKDFVLAYQLYLGACFRMLDEHLLPALWICEDVDSFLEPTLESLALLLRDFSNNPSFVPVLTASVDRLPGPLSELPVYKVPMRHFSLKDGAVTARKLYPGLLIPKDDLKSLRRVARGKVLTFTHVLRSLEREGVITRRGRKYSWAREEGDEPLAEESPLSLAWRNVDNLQFALKRVLYVVYLQSGLLDLWGTCAFLRELQIGEADVFGFLDILAEQGLVHITNHVVPLFPQFRKRLRRLVIKQEPELEDRLVDFLVDLWKAGKYPHRVLLYFLLSKTRRPELAMQVLASLLRHKLDELDFSGVRLFLDPKYFRLVSSLSAEAQKDLQMLFTAVRMRLCLLSGDRKQAEELYLKAMEMGGDFQTRPIKGQLFRQIAAYLLSRGEANMSLQWIKKGVIQFQGSGDTAGERAATAELGNVLLAEGKFEEALEYLTLAEQSPTPALELEDVISQALRGVTLFLLGNLSRALDDVERGLARARFLKNRGWELFLEFLRARILFEFGFYPEALLSFQQALATEALYECPAARQVLYAWLGRCYGYMGATDSALRVLEQGEERWESHLFLAEIRLFREEYLRAMDHCDRALAQNKVLDAFPGMTPKWLDGFWDIECRCLILLRENAMSRRLIQSMQAYLWSLEGSGERGIEQLYSVTRGERLPEADPYQSLYNYFYAESLPEVRKDELDDSLTVLNKALKLLQQRASRIEDSTLRWRYLNSNYWNARLFAEAKRKKLL
jgi:tetratricopeptide (TPR) repeat protein